MKKGAEARRGALTVETAIVFPVILLTILGMFYMSIIKYQDISAATAAIRTASRASAYWSSMGSRFAWGIEAGGARAVTLDFSEHDPYRYLIDGNTANRIHHSQSYMNWLISGNPQLLASQYEQTGVPTIQKTGNFIQQYVKVTVKKSYLNPMGNMLEIIGIPKTMEHTISATAPLTTPGEFARNISFIYEIVKGR